MELYLIACFGQKFYSSKEQCEDTVVKALHFELKKKLDPASTVSGGNFSNIW